MLKYGLVCISEILKEQDSSNAFQTMTKKQFLAGGKEAKIILGAKILHNLRLTQKIIKHCADNKIFHYRLSSGMFPLITEPTLGLSLNSLSCFSSIVSELVNIGQAAYRNKVSLSLHPDQFILLCSSKPEVNQKSIKELNFWGEMLNGMGQPQDYNCPINIHPGVSPKDGYTIEQLMNNLIESFKGLDNSVKRRLVFENQDSGYWNCSNLYNHFYLECKSRMGIGFPLTLDNNHDLLNPSPEVPSQIRDYLYWFKKFYMTWGLFAPVFHFSASKDKSGAHSDYLLDFPPDYGCNVTYEIEVKAKDKAILEILKNNKK